MDAALLDALADRLPGVDEQSLMWVGVQLEHGTKVARASVAAFAEGKPRHKALLVAGVMLLSATDALVADTLRRYQGKPVQCCAGCSHCCWMHVSATAAEAAVVAEYLETQRPDLAPRVRQRAAEVAQRTNGMRSRKRKNTVVWCPCLGDDGRCLIYPVRPSKCRTCVSGDREACRKLSENPSRRMTVPGLPQMAAAADGFFAGVILGLKDCGIRCPVGDFNLLLNDALRKHGATSQKA